TVALLSASILVVALAGFAGVVIQWRRAEAALGLAAEKAESERRVNARLEQNVYHSLIALADRELAADNSAPAQGLLGQCPGRLRGWEWYHLKRAPGRHVRILPGPGGRAFGTAFSPDGSQLAAGFYEGTIRLWDVASGRETAVLRGHTGPVHTVAFSP